MPRPGFATFIVLWTIALAAIIVVALQSISHRQAAAGRYAVARARAYWAARAGVEAQIAELTKDTLTPDQNSALSLRDSLANVARGTLFKGAASYRVQHPEFPDVRDGALDAHSRININVVTPESLVLVPDMDTGIAEALVDWIDEDDEPEPNGAEESQYASIRSTYKPRNAPMRSLRELELVLGVSPEYLRGEDWNLNGLLDPNENDGDASFPPDNPDGQLNAGWSRYFTAFSDESAGPGYGLSGQPRIDLTTASADDLSRRVSIDTTQAETILAYVSTGGSLGDFLDTDLQSMTPNTGNQLNGGGQAQPSVQNLTIEQIGVLLDETYTPSETEVPRSGKVNINSVDGETLSYISEISSSQLDALLAERDARSDGFIHFTDLLDVPSFTRETLAELYPYLCVKSNVFVAVSRGRDEATGVEVEVQAVLDRSKIPVIIKDLIVR